MLPGLLAVFSRHLIMPGFHHAPAGLSTRCPACEQPSSDVLWPVCMLTFGACLPHRLCWPAFYLPGLLAALSRQYFAPSLHSTAVQSLLLASPDISTLTAYTTLELAYRCAAQLLEAAFTQPLITNGL